MPRLFTGVELPAALAQRLVMLRGGIDGARWIDAENFHITLRYVGDISEPDADDFANALDSVRCEPFSITLSGVTSFGGKKPRTLFAGVARSEPLDRLRKAHDHAAEKAGLPPEGRKFTPHVTLARLRHVTAAEVAAYLNQHSGFLSDPVRVSRFILYSSRASKGGGPYVKEAVYPLAMGAGQTVDKTH